MPNMTPWLHHLNQFRLINYKEEKDVENQENRENQESRENQENLEKQENTNKMKLVEE